MSDGGAAHLGERLPAGVTNPRRGVDEEEVIRTGEPPGEREREREEREKRA